MQAATLTVRGLLGAAGHSELQTWESANLAIQLADAVANTIGDKIRKVQFIGKTASVIANIPAADWGHLKEELQSGLEQIEGVSVSPCGATEIWGIVYMY